MKGEVRRYFLKLEGSVWCGRMKFCDDLVLNETCVSSSLRRKPRNTRRLR
jgi:hypothetical protein